MSRSCPFRRDISDACSWHQDQALNSNIYILSQTGPTGFLVKEENETKNYKVFLGDVHNCTCPSFKKEKDLCIHICFILLKKFKLVRTDERTWQLGLNEREINQIIRGDAAQDSQAKKAALKNKTPIADSGKLQQREITEVDCCPICQDELLNKKLPVTYCRFGCGNNVHIQCMKVYADHQKSNGETQLKCPLCRETFNSFENLDIEYRNNGLFKAVKQDLHYGIVCKSCLSTPISGKCYKCTSCPEFYLCQACFNTDFHKEHNFLYREKVTSKYLKANRDNVGLMPQAIAEHLANRDLTDQDYDLLLQLDERNKAFEANNFSTLTEKIIKTWPSERVRENSSLLQPGIQCRICLKSYLLNQIVRKLPNCKHKFHSDCIDNWLIHSHPTCPIDGQLVWDPLAAEAEKEEKKKQKQTLSQQQQQQLPTNSNKFFEPLGLIINNKINNISENKQSLIVNSMNNVCKINLKKKIPSTRLSATEKKTNLGITIQGRNLSATNPNATNDLNEYTNDLISSKSIINQNNSTIKIYNKTKIKPIKSSQSIGSNNSGCNKPPASPATFLAAALPQIEVKGNKINDAYNLEMNIIGPYQLSKVNNNSKTSDFNKITYDDDDDDEEDFNYNEDYFDEMESNYDLTTTTTKTVLNDNYLETINNNEPTNTKIASKLKLRTSHPPMLLKKTKFIEKKQIEANKINNLNMPAISCLQIETKKQQTETN